jgi:hypothetical protein
MGQTIGGLARPMLRGVRKLGFKFTLTMAGYDLIRLPKLIAATAQTCRSNIQPFGRPLNDTTHTTSGGF